MKIQRILYIALSVAVLSNSCRQDIVSDNLKYPALQPTNLDTNAGSWRPILLSKPDEFGIANPISTTSADYKLELLEIKSRQNNRTDEEEIAIKYWSAGVILRWNEIMRELVAKYNLTPYQNPDGTYPIPSEQPIGLSIFPICQSTLCRQSLCLFICCTIRCDGCSLLL